MAFQRNMSRSFRVLSSRNHGSFEYDVFLSFRGEDTRNNFTGFFHYILELHGVHAFFDEEDLPKGERIEVILEAVTNSKILVPIFSQRYAESKWCLKEVAKMVECVGSGQERRIIPIFFDVDPTDVRNQTGPFEAAFKKHQKKNRDEVDGWRRALGYIGGISGYHLKDQYKGNQPQLVASIVDAIQKVLTTKRLLHEEEYLVGVDVRVDEIINRLDIEAKGARIIGIHGIGGIGKTTLAKAIYNRNRHRFQASCFIENVREVSKSSKGLVQLQQQLVQDISKDKHKKEIHNSSQGAKMIEDMVRGKSVLLVLDDVDDQKQLDALAGNISRFHSGSRVIVTTRQKKILERLQDEAVYSVEELEEKEALQLFNHHAFGVDGPQEEYINLIGEVVSISKRVPLAIQVLGAHFKRARTPEQWKKWVKDLRRRQHSDIHEKLRICYDSLNDEEKQIFLDIACLLVGKNSEDSIYVWEDLDLLPDQALQSLQDRSLIKINKEKEFEMHDLLRDMGREVFLRESSRHPENRSRWWDTGDIMEALSKSQGNMTEGIILNVQEGRKIKLSTEAFELLSKLRILHINLPTLGGCDFKHFPASLKWLEWKGCPLKTLPLESKFKSLVVLSLSGSSISQLWSETTTGSSSNYEKEFFYKLKVLDLSSCHCLIATPNFAMAPNLEKLILNQCRSLKEVDDSIGYLKKLVFLSMRDCLSLEKLPNKIYELSSLQVFNLEGCRALVAFPQILEDSKSVTELHLDGTPPTFLPTSTSRIPHINQTPYIDVSNSTIDGLKVLDLSSCHCLIATPNFAMAPNLEKLILDHCISLKEVDDSIEYLKKLAFLSMRECVSLKKLPNKIYELSSLEVFNLEGCRGLVALPQMLEDSKSIVAEGTPVTFLPTSTSRILYINRTPYIDDTNSTIDLSNSEGRISCENLKFLPDHPHRFPSLRSLHIDGCLQDMSFRVWDIEAANISGSPTLPQKQEFSFVFPVGSISDPLLVQQLRCHGSGDPSLNGTMVLRLHHKELTNERWILLESHEAHSKDCNSKDDGYGHCYTINFGSNNKINEVPRGKTTIMKVTTSKNCKLTKVDLKLQKRSKFSDENMKPFISISRREASTGPPPSLSPPSSRRSELQFSIFFNHSEEEVELDVIKYSTGIGNCIDQIMKPLNVQCDESMLLFGWTIRKLIIIFALILSDINVLWYELGQGTGLPRPASLEVTGKIRILDLSYCKYLVKTHDFARSPCLEKLVLDHCENLLEIDESIGQLKNLILLSIVGCTKLGALPDAIGSLMALEELNVAGCSSLVIIPGLEKLISLELLKMRGCLCLDRERIRSQFQKRSKFSGENMKPFIGISRREASTGSPPSLLLSSSRKSERQFSIFFNHSEEEDKLVVIEYSTRIDNCMDQIMNQLKFGEPKLLFGWTFKELFIIFTLILSDINVLWYERGHGTGLPRPASSEVFDKIKCQIKILDLSDCKFLVKTHDFSWSPYLVKLVLDRCEHLLEIDESIGQLKNLIRLSIVGCTKLRALPCGILQLNSLQVLNIEKCPEIRMLPEAMDVSLDALEVLILDECTSLTGIPDYVGRFRRLRHLSLRNCDLLEQLPTFAGRLTALEELNVAGCSSLVCIPGLETLISLKVLHMCGCLRFDLKRIRSQFQKAEFHDLEAFNISIFTRTLSHVRIPFPIGRRTSSNPLLLEQIDVLVRTDIGWLPSHVSCEIKVAEPMEDGVPCYVDAYVSGEGLTPEYRAYSDRIGEDDEINKCLRELAATSSDRASRVGTLDVSCCEQNFFAERYGVHMVSANCRRRREGLI